MPLNNEKLIFITGASRSGTTLLSFVLRSQSRVFGLKELHYFGQHWDPRNESPEASEAELVAVAADILMRQSQGILTNGDSSDYNERAETLVRQLKDADRNYSGSICRGHKIAGRRGRQKYSVRTNAAKYFLCESIARYVPERTCDPHAP